MSKRSSSSSKRKRKTSPKGQSTQRKKAASKRRNVARRTAASKTLTKAKTSPVVEMKANEPADPAEISVDQAEDLLNLSAEKASKKPSKHTMKVSLKAPGVGEAEPADQSDKPSKNTMKVSLKAPGVGDASSTEKPSKHTMKVSLKAPVADSASGKTQERKISARKPAAREAVQKVANKVSNVDMGSKAPAPMAPPEESHANLEPTDAFAANDTAPPKGLPKETMRVSLKAPSVEDSAAAIPTPVEASPEPVQAPISEPKPLSKETMRVSLKAPAAVPGAGVSKETMRVDLKAAPTDAPVSKETHSVTASSNPFVKNTREPGSVSVDQPAQPLQGAQNPQAAPVPQLTKASSSKGGGSDLLVILAYTACFLAVILGVWWFFLR